MADLNDIDFNRFIKNEEVLKTAARSTRALGKSVTDLAATVDKDAARIKAGLEQINTAIAKVQGAGGSLNLSNPTEKKQLQDLVAEFGKLTTAKALLRETEKAQAVAMATVTGAAKEQTDALKAQKQALREAVASGDAEMQKKVAAAIRQTTQENKQLTAALRGVNSEFTAAKGSYDALTVANSKLLAQLRGLEGGLDSTSKEAQGLRIQIAANTSTLTDFDKQLGQNFRNVGNYPKGLKAVGAGALSLAQDLSGLAFGLAGVAQALSFVFDQNVKYSADAVAVRKTTGQTAEEFDRLADSLKDLDTPTSLAGLLEIAKVGGALGETKDTVLDFTKSVDTAVQALGDDFAGGAEQIATELGKISNVFRNELGSNTAENILSIGSAVNELGAVGAATAPFLTDVALRVGAVSAQTGVGLKNVFAYAAVLEETGFSAERSGTSLNRLFSTLSTKTEESFRIAQKASPSLTLKEFTRLVNTDFNAAIQLFLKGLNAGGKNTTELNKLLGTLKLQSGEAKNVIITLAQNTELFAQRQQVANDQLRDATSLSKEAKLAGDSLSGSVSKLKNDIGELATGPEATGVLKFFVDLIRENKRLAVGIATLGLSEAIRSAYELKEALLPTVKAQQDYTVPLVANTLAQLKQVASGQQLLDAYAKLALATQRTATEEAELSTLREKLRAQYGTADVDQIQARIKAQQDEAAATKKGLEANLASQDDYLTKVQQKTADLQRDATAAQAAFAARFKLSPEGIKNIQEAARSSAIANTLSGRSFSKEQVDAARELNRVQDALADSTKRLTAGQLTRAQLAAALARLTPTALKGTQDQTDANNEQAESEETLDRAAKARSDARRARLQDELADNQLRIDDTKKYQAEQAKLFEGGQITPELFAERVAGSQDLITQLERDGIALRLRIAREETTGKLAEIENERIRLSNKKNVTQAELTDIEGQASAKRVAAAQEEARKVAQIVREGRERLEEKPIEFIAPLDTKSLQKELDKADKAIQRSVDNSEAQIDKAGKAYAEALEKEVRAKQVAENRKQFLQQQTFDFAATLAQGYFTYQQGQLDQQADAESAQYDESLKNAGENQVLREKIEAEHQKRLAEFRRKAAEQERNQALFTVALNTAQAVTSVLSTGGGTRYADFGISAGFLTALVIAQGLAQTAAILAKPIPQFFTGRRGGEAVPFATVAERGPELIHRKQSGRLEYVAKPSFASLGAGDSVYTAAETAALMQGAYADQQQMRQPMQVDAMLRSATVAIQAGRVEQAPKRELLELHKAIQSIPAAIKGMKNVTVNVHGEGASASIKQGSSLTQSMNQRLQGYGT